MQACAAGANGSQVMNDQTSKDALDQPLRERSHCAEIGRRWPDFVPQSHSPFFGYVLREERLPSVDRCAEITRFQALSLRLVRLTALQQVTRISV
jgi:hypothetical protein